MTRPPDAPSEGVPPSIAAIMAAIRAEVTGPAAVPPPVAVVPVETARVAAPPAPPDTAAPTPPAGDAGEPAVAAAPPLPPSFDTDVRAEVAPLVKAWLDAHLPEIVEAAVHAEIRRLTGAA